MAHDVFAETGWQIEQLPTIRGKNSDGINYPSVWPASGYLLKGDLGYNTEIEPDGTVTLHTPDEVVGLEEFLIREGLTPLRERTPVLTIGSNRAPRQLHDKLAALEQPTDDDLTVPVLAADIMGLDVVFAARPSLQGNFPASLYAGSETERTTVQLGIAFLNKRQLKIIDKTERGVYKRAKLAGSKIEVGGKPLQIQYYKGKSAVFWDERGPRSLEAVEAEGRTISMHSQADFIDIILAKLSEHGGMNALVGIYFDSRSKEDTSILESYRNTPPYPQELSAVIQHGQHVGTERRPHMAATKAFARMMGEIGISKVVRLPWRLRVQLRSIQQIK